MLLYEEAWAKNHHEAPGLTWDELLAAVGLGSSEVYEQAKAFFVEALAPYSTRFDYLSTVIQLRESPIRDEVDLEFCFSHLPPTEKNLFLKKLTLLYLKSPLSETDRMARTTRLPDCGYLQQHPVLTAATLTLVKARLSSPLFQELHRILAALRGDLTTRVLETWEISENPSEHFKTPLVLRHTSPYVLLDRLVEAVGAEAKRNRTTRIFFEGSAASRAYLLCAAAARGMRLKAPQEPRSSFPGGLERIRQSPLPLNERLRLSRLFQQTKAPREFSEWLELQKLANDYKALLSQSAKKPTKELFQTKEQGIVLPFHPLPPKKNVSDLFYLEPIPEPQGTLAFDSSERFRLFSQGFVLPEADPLKSRKVERLEALLRFSRRRPRVFMTADFPWATQGRLIRAKAPLTTKLDPVPVTVPSPLLLSATALEAFADCPSKYFFSHVLKFRKTLPEERSFALFFGKLVHRTLEWAFQENAWDLVDESLLLRLFERALEEAKEPTAPWFKVSLRQRFHPFASKVASLERSLREALGPLTPTRFEQNFEFTLAGAQFRGRIDRIDRSENGSLLIVDYKTGTVDFSPEHIKKGHHFQALLYLLSQKEPLAGIVFYDLKGGEVRRGILRDREGIKKLFTRGHALSVEGWDSLIALGTQHIQTRVSQIQAGDFKATPSPAVCDRCDMGPFCHRQSGVSG